MSWNKIIWTEEMIVFIKNNYNKLTNQQLADRLGLKLTSVRTKCYELGLYKMKLEYWTIEQIQYLKDNYKIIGDTELAEIFNEIFTKNKTWTKKHIEKKRRNLNLKRTSEELETIREDWQKKGLYKESNRKAWVNRGVNPLGTIRIWGNGNYKFKVIKTGTGYENYARWLWRINYGEIPKKHNISFKDFNNMNVVIENLECISNQEKMNRNSIAKFPQDLRNQIWKVNKLKNRISKILKNKQ